MELDEWIRQVVKQLREGDDSKAYNANQLLPLLSSSSISTSTFNSIPTSISSILQLPINDSIVKLWKDFITNHVLYLSNKVKKADPNKLFGTFNQSFISFTKIYKKLNEGKWSAPLVKWFCNNLHKLAKHADGNFKSTGKSPDNYNEAVRTIQQQFGACQISTGKFPYSKLYGVVYCINILCKIFFKLNKIQACATLSRWYEQNHNSIPLKVYPMSIRVTFKYFMGRMALYSMDEEKAKEYLEFAAKHCNKQAVKNKTSIIRYLIPLKLNKGIYPSEELLDKYNLNEYKEISKAIHTGHILKFNEELELYEQLFISNGLYVIMNKLRYVTYRNLLKKALMIINPSNRHMRLEDFRRALEISSGENIDALEVESLVASMIDNKHLLGYILHERGLIIMTKYKEVFPPILNTRL